MATCKNKPAFLVESCLLTFGLVSVSEAALAESWRAAGLDGAPLCWIKDGEITVGTMEEYLPFRASRPSGKFALDDIDAALAGRLSGALTASGTMEVCRRLGVRCAVSGGIGGIGDVKGEELCPDLPALRDLPVALVCTSPKDMLDIPATIGWLRNAVTDSAGSVETVEVGGVTVKGSTLRSILGLRSACFEWEVEDGRLRSIREALKIQLYPAQIDHAGQIHGASVRTYQI